MRIREKAAWLRISVHSGESTLQFITLRGQRSITGLNADKTLYDLRVAIERLDHDRQGFPWLGTVSRPAVAPVRAWETSPPGSPSSSQGSRTGPPCIFARHTDRIGSPEMESKSFAMQQRSPDNADYRTRSARFRKDQSNLKRSTA